MNTQIEVDIPCDPPRSTRPGDPWAFLDEAKHPHRIEAGAIVITGDAQDPVFARVRNLTNKANGTKVHLEILPSDPHDCLDVMRRHISSPPDQHNRDDPSGKPRPGGINKSRCVGVRRERTLAINDLRRRFAERMVDSALRAVGVELNGPNPWDPQIHDRRALQAMVLHGNLGAGEAYMDGMWDCERIDELAARVSRPDVTSPEFGARVLLAKDRVADAVRNAQRRDRAVENARHHYAIGNELYETMLGSTMAYSCAYWRHATTLDEAQTAKFDLICRKLGLEPGMRVLDVGCGWGGFMRYAAERFGVEVVGLTPVIEQAQVIELAAKHDRLDIKVLVQDYRDPLFGQFDRIASIGMFEHVGHRNYKTYFQRMRDLLTDDGLFLLHTIGENNDTHRTTDPWIKKYIFPGGLIPSMKVIAEALDGLLLVEDVHSFGPYYDTTLMAWSANFNDAWPVLRRTHPVYDERFARMWNYYLLTAAGSFRNRSNNLWQFVLSKHGIPGGYESVR